MVNNILQKNVDNPEPPINDLERRVLETRSSRLYDPEHHNGLRIAYLKTKSIVFKDQEHGIRPWKACLKTQSSLF